MTKEFIRYLNDGKPFKKSFPLQRNQKEQIEFEKQLFETAGWQPADATKIPVTPKKQTREELLRLLADTEDITEYVEKEEVAHLEKTEATETNVKRKYNKKQKL